MELELGLKLTNVADEFTSDFQLAKDRAGPVFVSRETDALFILTAHLKGYLRRNIKIDINEDGSLIGISGERQVKETVMVGWKVHKKDREIKGFKKVYKIPNGVILDEINAIFNDDESTLKITMPKKVKGVVGSAIEEVKDKPELVREGSGSLQIKEEEKNAEIYEPKNDQQVVDHAENDERKEQPETYKGVPDKRVEEEKAGPSAVEPPGEGEGGEDKARGFKMCIPIVAGSTLFLTFVAFVIHMIRSKHQTGRRRD